MVAENEKPGQHSAEEPAARLGSGVYVDVENLQTAAQEVVRTLMKSWPDAAPPPSRLYLYVRADHSDLWSMWAESRFPGVAVKANGIQHFSKDAAKNSADIAIAIDALSDFLTQRVGWVVVVSDDSDFISLYSKIRDKQAARGHQPGNVPFLWVVTDRPRTRSLFMQEFFPNSHVHTVHFQKAEANAPAEMPRTQEHTSDPYDAMAQAIIRETDIGIFKSSETQNTIKKHWPSHSLAKASKQTYGEEFRKKLLPSLQELGVTEPNPNKKPREYGMTAEAKSSVS